MPQRRRRVLRECRRRGVGCGVSAAQRLRAGAGLRPRGPLQRNRTAPRSRPDARADARHPHPAADPARLHRLGFRVRGGGVPARGRRLAARGPDQASRGHRRRAGERAGGLHGPSERQKLRQASGAGRRADSPVRSPEKTRGTMRAEQMGNGSAGAIPPNPLLGEWATPFELPPFTEIAPEHFRPAFDQALAEHRAEIAAIADDPASPSFANTIDAFEKAGRGLDRVASVFFNLTGAHTSDALQAIEREMAPALARHRSAIFLNTALFRRIDDLFARRDSLGLTPEQARVLDRYHIIFVRAGARLDPAAKERLAAITERLATLGTRFSQNVLSDERDYTLVLETEEDLAGLPTFVRAAAARAAADRGLEG